ncbi:mono-functional DNA-alkylating methyl methanesulfonate n-term domain-containing protein [Ditylenchus destructor]|uniref:DNA damage-binding protein 1 n=1 Tax=Ditylenchus destructor TaxID=166010 RepID=A0AAD4R333_9BILA|nr:mono-functional DNA-alkylating methyl methanesulfonate n-term domain-containing protein [Ditylenchus destructor]
MNEKCLWAQFPTGVPKAKDGYRMKEDSEHSGSHRHSFESTASHLAGRLTVILLLSVQFFVALVDLHVSNFWVAVCSCLFGLGVSFWSWVRSRSLKDWKANFLVDKTMAESTSSLNFSYSSQPVTQENGSLPNPSGALNTRQSANNYIVSAQKPTVVNAAVVGNFRNETELDLVLAKVNRIECLLVTAEGLKPHREVPIYGRIATVVAFRLPGESLDSLLILTVKYDLAVIQFTPTGEVRTRASGHVSDRVGRPAETGIIACVHASGLIALRLYEGHLKLVQWDDNKELKCFNVRFEDHNVTDVAFLENTDKPTVAYFYVDLHGKHLKICEIDLDEKELMAPLWRQGNIEAEATLLIPIPAPYGGLVIVGKESISYQKSANHYHSISPPNIHMSEFNCYARIDKTGERFLLGDVSGRLFMLLLVKDRDPTREGGLEIKDLKIELLGDISAPECLVYLDNSVAFVGSRYGDSQLIRLSTEPVEPNNFVNVIDTYNNLAPIRDMVIIDNDGQSQVVTCSGAFKDGSLRVIRSGIGIDILASVEMPSLKGIFPLKLDSEYDRFMVLSLPSETHVVQFEGEEMADVDIPDFSLTSSTLYAGNFGPNRIVQVTAEEIRLISGDGSFKNVWRSPARVSLCSVNPNSGQILLGSGENILYVVVREDQITLEGQTTCRNEVACLDISPIVAFVGSRYGDSQLIRLSTEPVEPNNFVNVIDTYNNLAPIRDMDGSLRVIRSGIGIDILASVEMPSLKGIFPLKLDSEFDRFMVLSLPSETHVVQFEGEEMADVDIPEEGSTSAVFAAGFWNDQTVAIYSVVPEIRVICEERLSGDVLPRSVMIVNMESIIYLMVALGDGTVYYFRIDSESGNLTEQKKVTLGTQPTTLRKFTTKGIANVFACSDRPTVIYSANQKLAFSNVNMKMATQVAQLNSDYYKECVVMSDGENLVIGTIDDIQKLHIRTIPLGECVSRIAYQPETNTIAILTTRREIVTDAGERILCRDSVSTSCPSKTAQNQMDKGIASAAPRTSHNDLDGGEMGNGGEQEVHSLCVLDANTFECLYVYEFDKAEFALSLCTAILGADAHPYYAVGTAYVYPDDTESKLGRILVFQVQGQKDQGASSTDGGKLRLLAEKEVKDS